MWMCIEYGFQNYNRFDCLQDIVDEKLFYASTQQSASADIEVLIHRHSTKTGSTFWVKQYGKLIYIIKEISDWREIRACVTYFPIL